MNNGRTGLNAPRGYTLIELMVTLVIISILASLTLGGLAVARQRVKRDRTEMTIRKIHEVVMPHFERFLNRNVPTPTWTYVGGAPTSTVTALQGLGNKGMTLIGKRRMMTLELPDSWKDLVTANDPLELRTADSGVSRQLRRTLPGNAAPDPPNPAAAAAAANVRASQFSDAECLWLSVMRAGYADQAIIGHFRSDEFGDKDNDGQREFIDGWGNPIRFLRWAPGFVSRYQPMPDASLTETRSHDAIDPAGIDPLARNTLFPLIFSSGPDGEPDIACRDDESGGGFTYAAVAYDPYFVPSVASFPPYYANPAVRDPPSVHLSFTIRGHRATPPVGPYTATASQYANRMFGSFATRVVKSAVGAPLVVISDDVHNHSMSR